MKLLILLAALSLLPACTTQPPVSGTFVTKAGQIKVHPDGRFEIIIEPRTYKEQDALYAQGRSTPGPKVTNAPAGYSWHNFGVGWDFVVFDSTGQPQWESPLMEKCGRIAESLGLEWGGHWTNFQDIPHIQIKTGCTLADARQRVKDGTWWT